MLKERSTLHKVNQEAYARVFKELLTGACSAHDLADVSGLHLVTVHDLMRCLKRHKVVHIAAWEPNTRGVDSTAVFALGRGKDVARRCKPRAQVTAEYRERKRLRELVNLTATKGETTP